ncbi:uncharacterized protein LOC62_03G004411 [Vanrija pseudolonga]|uniref:Selenoprotein W n=1 Tax=Vanrija pseudolonga TaxID=143232 RepID=A0AAF0Y9Z1_9TREE|nr:hypothetical protein LOC62_03G004411 [Vanrija pseudolonga]
MSTPQRNLPPGEDTLREPRARVVQCVAPPPLGVRPEDRGTILPPVANKPHVLIAYCDRCRWSPRASWTQTELFLTFPPPLIGSITLQPLNTPETGGQFRVWIDMGVNRWQLVWDRKTEGGFPELKVLKQRIRNIVQPDMGLGHSDVKGKAAAEGEDSKAEAGGKAE